MNLLSNNNRSRLHAQIPQQLKLCLAMMLILVFATGNLSFAASGSSSPTLPAPVAIGALPTDGCTAQGFDATSSIPSLRQCLSNLGGGTSACAALNANDQQSEYLQCWCLQQTQQSNCFQTFCPQDPTGTYSALTNTSQQICKLAPAFNSTTSTSTSSQIGGQQLSPKTSRSTPSTATTASTASPSSIIPLNSAPPPSSTRTLKIVMMFSVGLTLMTLF